jgi:hypothetical protein
MRLALPAGVSVQDLASEFASIDGVEVVEASHLGE